MFQNVLSLLNIIANQKAVLSARRGEREKNERLHNQIYNEKRRVKKWVINITADSAKEAKEKMLNMWNSDLRLCGMHPFHIEIKLLKAHEEFKYHYFALIGD